MAEDNKSIGTTLEVNDGSATPVVHIQELSGPGLETGTIDTTDYGTSDRFNTFMAGNTDAGEIEATVKYDPAEHTMLIGLVAKDDDGAGALPQITITFPDSSEYACAGFVTGLENTFASADSDGLITNTLTIKLSGKPTFTDNTGI